MKVNANDPPWRSASLPSDLCTKKSERESLANVANHYPLLQMGTLLAENGRCTLPGGLVGHNSLLVRLKIAQVLQHYILQDTAEAVCVERNRI